MPMRFELPYDDASLQATVERAAPKIPESFLWGVATAGYQAEGGFNGTDDPKNNWHGWEGKDGRDATGRASDFWNRYEEDFDRAAAMGLNCFRMSVEWARIQPASDPTVDIWNPPEIDEAALDHYARIIAAARHRGLEPIVTLHHFTHPLWAGRNFWLEGPKVEDYFVPYVSRTIVGINDRLVEQHDEAPVRYWVTMNEPFVLAAATFLARVFPGDWDRGRVKAARTCFENVVIGHALSYRAIHGIYQGKKWDRPTVTFNSFATRIYAIDKYVQDLMLAPSLGIKKEKIGSFLAGERDRFRDAVGRLELPRDRDGARRKLEDLFDAWAWKAFNPDTMPRAVHVAFEDYHEPRLLDAVAFDYYDPFVANGIDLGLPPKLRMEPWKWSIAPSALPAFLKAYSQPAHGLPVMILENGFAFDGEAATGAPPRFDGARRADGLKAHLYGCLQALAEGVDLRAFCHWTITDNYEWGSFRPRFGLHAVDYSDGSRRLEVDALGDDAAGAYGRLARAMASRDPAELLAAFRAP